jgi:hypothetical protein
LEEEIRKKKVDGFEFGLKVIKRKKSKGFWETLFSVFLGIFGLIQVIAGCAVMVFSGGAAYSIGISLIIEGTKDIYKAIKSWITGIPINFKEWIQDKAIALCVTFLVSGTEALKELSTMGSQLVKSMGETSLK